MLSSKDINFVGYTYKNFEIVSDSEMPGIGNIILSIFVFHVYLMLYFCFLLLTKSCYLLCRLTAELKKKSTKVQRPSIKSLFGMYLIYFPLMVTGYMNMVLWYITWEQEV